MLHSKVKKFNVYFAGKFFPLLSSCRKVFVKCNIPYLCRIKSKAFQHWLMKPQTVHPIFLLLEIKRSLETGSKEPAQDCGQYKTGSLKGSISSITVEYHFQTVTQPRMNSLLTYNLGKRVYSLLHVPLATSSQGVFLLHCFLRHVPG